MSPENDAGKQPLSACPACAGRLVPRELTCVDCGLLVQTRYRANEFVDLDDDSLHLLRIFVACEGRIRAMERALGVSYPTVKSRLGRLRDALGIGRDQPGSAGRQATISPARRRAAVLDSLEAGEIDFDEAMRMIANL